MPLGLMARETFPPLLTATLASAQRVDALSLAAAAGKDDVRLPATTAMMRATLETANLALKQHDAACFRFTILLLLLNCLRCGEVMCPTAVVFDLGTRVSMVLPSACVSRA